MCNLVKVQIDGKDIVLADIKKDCIHNIVDAAKKCKYINRIILFGSALEDRCTEESDVDIAVFGSLSKNKCLSTKEYKDFTRQLYSFDDFNQTYDILYFKNDSKDDSFIRREIEKGAVIYG